jgi:hypothetical protein
MGQKSRFPALNTYTVGLMPHCCCYYRLNQPLRVILIGFVKWFTQQEDRVPNHV